MISELRAGPSSEVALGEDLGSPDTSNTGALRGVEPVVGSEVQRSYQWTSTSRPKWTLAPGSPFT